MSKRGLMLVFFVLLGAAAIAWLALRDAPVENAADRAAEGPPVPSSPAGPSASRDFAPRTSDPALQREPGVVSRGRVDNAAELAAEAESLAGMYVAQREKWRPLMVLDRHDRMVEAKYRCAEHLRGQLPSGQRCNYEISIVLRPDEGGGTAFDYAKGRDADDVGPACQAYVECLARDVWAAREDYPPLDEVTPFSIEGRVGDYLSRSVEDIEACISESAMFAEETAAEIDAKLAEGDVPPELEAAWRKTLGDNLAVMRACEYALEYKREHG